MVQSMLTIRKPQFLSSYLVHFDLPDFLHEFTSLPILLDQLDNGNQCGLFFKLHLSQVPFQKLK